VPGARVRDSGAHQAQRVEAVVLEEAPVLGRDDGIHHRARHEIKRNVVVDAAALPDEGAVAGQHPDRRLARVRAQVRGSE
jgi:hypothetical protein